MSLSSSRPRRRLSSLYGGRLLGRRNLSVPSGHLPFQGRLLVQGWLVVFNACNFLLHTPALSDKTFRQLYTVSRRNAMERNRRNARLCPPGKAPIQAMAGGIHGVRGQTYLHGNLGWSPGGFAYFARVQSRSSVHRRTKRSLAGNPARRCAAKP